MTEPLIRHLLDQASETFADMAPVLGRYFKALVESGVSPEGAVVLVRDAQIFMFRGTDG